MPLLAIGRNGELLVVGDAAGGVYGFDGKSGAMCWQHPEIHDGGLLALAIQPGGDLLATAGQDGRVRFESMDGEIIHTLNLGVVVENVAGPQMDNGWLPLSPSGSPVDADGQEDGGRIIPVR